MTVLPSDARENLASLVNAAYSGQQAALATIDKEWVPNRPDMLLMGLVELRTAQESIVRQIWPTQFRRYATRTVKNGVNATSELFLSLQKPQRDAIRAELLQAFFEEKDVSTRRMIADAVAEIARQYVDSDAFAVQTVAPANKEIWTELLGALFQASQSPDATMRAAAFRIFATTPGIIEKQHEEVVIGAFEKGLKDEDMLVQIETMKAFKAFFDSLQKKQQQKYFNLVPDILNILPPLQEKKDSENLAEALIALIALAEQSTRMFKPLFSGLCTFSIGVVKDTQLEDKARQLALELMTTFAEVSPQMCKHEANYAEQMVTQCLSLMTEVGMDDEDASDWNDSEDLDAEDNGTNSVAGLETMDRLANKLGGPVILPPTFNWLPRMISSGNWRDRHAALMALSAISEGCQELMESELSKVLDMVVPALEDPHPRVRWAACNALGQMSTDFKGTMQTLHHQTVLSSLIPKLLSTEPRVASHAAAALVNFCEEAEKDILEPYLDMLLNNLFALSQNSRRYVQEQALSTIATVADSAETRFSKYYDSLMPLLFDLLREKLPDKDADKERRPLRAKAMECATLIALAVGKERMGPDGRVLVELLGRIQESITDDDDPQSDYLLHCWGRMCRVLDVEFLPYLPAVMPPLLIRAKAKADVVVLESNDTDEGWEVVQVKGKYIAVKTSTLDDKHTAIDLLVIYAQHLGKHFEPYVLDVMENVAIPGLAFFFHDPVRVASAKCVPQLLASYKAAYGLESQKFQGLWSSTIEKVLEVLEAEPGIETLAEMYQCFYESVEVCGKGALNAKHMDAFIQSAEGVLEEYKLRVVVRLDEAKDREPGEEPDEDTLFAIEDDATLLGDMNKAFHTVFKNQSDSFLPYWERLLPLITQFITADDPTQRQWAICILDDVLEFCGPSSWKYNNSIMNPLIQGCQDPSPANRQAACYGIGVAAQHGGASWSEFASGALPLLFQACQRADAREEDHVFATENACAAIAKILHYNASKVQNVPEVTAAWLNTLPIVNDDEAAPFAYGLVAQLIDQQNQAVTANAAAVFGHVAKALEAAMLTGNTQQRVIEAAKRLIQLAGLDASQLLLGLEPATQVVVRNLFG